MAEQELRAILSDVLANLAPPSNEPEVLSEEAAAAYLGGIDPKTLARLALDKRIAHLPLGRKRLYPIAGLRQYVADHTVKTESNPWGLTDSGLRRLRSGRARG